MMTRAAMSPGGSSSAAAAAAAMASLGPNASAAAAAMSALGPSASVAASMASMASGHQVGALKKYAQFAHLTLNHTFLESTFHLLLLPGFSCGPLSISSQLSGSDILRSALRRPDGTVRSDGLPTRGCSPRIPIARSTKEGVKKRSSDTSCELLLNP